MKNNNETVNATKEPTKKYSNDNEAAAAAAEKNERNNNRAKNDTSNKEQMDYLNSCPKKVVAVRRLSLSLCVCAVPLVQINFTKTGVKRKKNAQK